MVQTVIEDTLEKNRIRFIDEAKEQGCQLVIFPEGALFWPEDAVHKPVRAELEYYLSYQTSIVHIAGVSAGELIVAGRNPTLPRFLRGDTNALEAADANDDGANDIADAIAVLSHLFVGSGDLPELFGECGIDPTLDELDCLEYSHCEGR